MQIFQERLLHNLCKYFHGLLLHTLNRHLCAHQSPKYDCPVTIWERAHVPGILPARAGHNGGPSLDDDLEFWFSLINERAMAEFMGLTDRTLQKWRRTGEGPKFVRISNRCVKYRRIDGREFSEARLRSSTSDPGQAA